jgi:leucyl-tRNA synthetase
MHQTVKRVTQDIDRIRFNPMVAALMEYTNHLHRIKEAGGVAAAAWQEAVRALLLMLAPTAPHLAEELWQRSGYDYSIHDQAWPEWDEALVQEDEITIVVQVNGKVRDKLTAPASVSAEAAKQMAQEQPKVKTHLEGKNIVNIIYVPGKLVNIVVK